MQRNNSVELAYYFAVSKDTIFRDVDFLNRYAPIYTKRGMFGGIFINDESRKNLLLYLSDDEEKLLKKLSANLDDTAKYYINNHKIYSENSQLISQVQKNLTHAV